MNNTSWSDAEIADVGMSWADFHAKHPARSYHAWRNKRQDVAHARRPAERDGWAEKKVAPELTSLADAPPSLSDADLFDAVLAYQGKLASAFPRPLEHRVRVPADEPIAVAFASDWHIGSEGTDLARLRSDCALIASHPRLYLALGGDVADNFIFEKMASAARTQAAGVEVQWRLFRYLVTLVQDSLLWVSSGNHDAWTHKAAALDPIMSSLHGIPVVYTGEGGWIDLVVGPGSAAQTYTVYRKHKPTRFNSNFNRTHWHKQMLGRFLPREADVLVTEHLHEQAMETVEYRGKQRVLIACGSYKVRDSWAESGGYYTGGYGVPCVIFYPGPVRRMLACWSIADALEILDGASFAA